MLNNPYTILQRSGNHTSQQVKFSLMKVLDWTKMFEICLTYWLEWLLNRCNTQEPSHTEVLHNPYTMCEPV